MEQLSYMGLKHHHVTNQCIQLQVVQSSQAPKKNTGFVSKAMEYMFGW